MEVLHLFFGYPLEFLTLKKRKHMKRIAVIILFLSLACVSGKAQSGFGIKAGLNFNSMSDIKLSDINSSVKGKTGFHVGVLYKLRLPLGLALQPELLYTQKNSTIALSRTNDPDFRYDSKLGYLQLPVNVQWGIDLVLFRPFIQVSPYIGYMISRTSDTNNISSDLNKFQYGIGLGAGLEIWKFQVSGRYCWDLGKLGEFDINKVSKVSAKNRGFELSLAVIF